MMQWEKYKKFIEKMFLIIDKNGRTQPFILNPVQERVLRDLSGMDIILKARQQGMTSLILAIFAVDFLTVENYHCAVISHEEKATQRLLDRAKFYVESLKTTFPEGEGAKLKYNSRHELVNTVKNSSFYIGTAGAKAFGHGDTLNAVHLSELSRYSNAENLLTGVLQAVPKGGRVTIESTANGYEYFHAMWVKNQDRSAAFKLHFIPWFETVEYALPVEKGTEFDQEELDLMNKYHLAPEQMAWRRWKVDQLNGNIDTFNEQFPDCPENAFRLSGNPVWSPKLLDWYMLHTLKPKVRGDLVGFQKIMVEENEKGYLTVYKYPNEFHTYVIGVDVSEGRVAQDGDTDHDSDYSCMQVIDQNTLEQVAVWHGRIDPDILARKADILGRYYNDALVAVERNSIGLTTLITLRDLNYPNMYYREKFGLIAEKTTPELGWVTDVMTKDLIINEATQLLREKRLKIYDEPTLGEMQAFIRDNRGHAKAASSSHDDRVMSYLIAVKMLGKGRTMKRTNDITRSDFDRENIFYLNGASFDSNGMPVDPNNMTNGDDTEFF